MPEPSTQLLANATLNLPIVMPVFDEDQDLATLEVPACLTLGSGLWVDDTGYDPEVFQQANMTEPMQFATLSILSQLFLDQNMNAWGELGERAQDDGGNGTWSLPPINEGVA